MIDDNGNFDCAFGKSKTDAHPKNQSFDDFLSFKDFVFANKAPFKGLLYICAAMSDGHRCKDSALDTKYIAFDFDGMPGLDTFNDLKMYLAQYSGFGYTTSRHTADAPRARAVLEASRPMTYLERVRVSMAIEQEIQKRLTGIVFDKSVYKSYQPIFNPLKNSEDFDFIGEPVDVDYLLQTAPNFEDNSASVKKNLDQLSTTDPVLQTLINKSMVKKDMGGGRFAVVCPCSDTHTSESTETSTIYSLPNFGGFTFGNFICLHDHCSGRAQPEFMEALGIDYGAVRAKQSEIPNPDHTDFINNAKQKKQEQEEQAQKDNIDPTKWPDPLDVFAEFPVPKIKREMLPEAIAGYTFDCGELIGVDPAMVAMPAIVACAAALHDGITIQPKRHEKGWTESARLWCALVGAPSVKKSPAIKRSTKELRKIDMGLHKQSDKDFAQHERDIETWEQAKKEARKTNSTLPNKPEKPARKRMVVEDVTVEALSEILKDNDRGVMGIMDELSGWFGAMDAYSGSKVASKDRAHWLEAYNGGGRIIDRIGRGSINISNWSVSMVGGIQPDAIRRVAKNMVDDGLMQRFIVVIGSNGQEYDRPEDYRANQAYQALVTALFALQPSDAPVTLSDEAHEERLSLDAYVHSLIDAASIASGLKSHLGKWSGLFARILLIYHAIECVELRQYPTAVKVSGETAKRVSLLMSKFLLPHAVAYYSNVLGASTDLEHVRQIAGLILSRRFDALSMGVLVANYRAWRGLDQWSKQRILESLEEMGWLKPQHDKSLIWKKGASSWVVNPKIHTKFAERAKIEAINRAKVRDIMVNLGVSDE